MVTGHVRPTPAGVAVAVGATGCYAASLLLGYPELAVLAAAGLVALLSAAAWVAHRPTLAVRRRVESTDVPRGATAVTELTVTNLGRWSCPPCDATDRIGEAARQLRTPRIPAGRTVVVRRAMVPTERRGALTVGPLVLRRRDPFGLLHRTQPLGGTVTVWVQPAVHAVRIPRAGRIRDLDGPERDAARDGSTTFSALREYVIGDDLRRVHWRTSARTPGRLMVRECVDPSRPDTVVLLDDRIGCYRDPLLFEEAVDVAASLVAGTRTAGYPVLLAVASGRRPVLAARADPRGLTRVLAEIDLAELGGEPTVAAVLRGLGGSSLLVVTGRAPQTDWSALRAARSRFDRVTVLGIDDPAAATAVGGVDILAAPTARELVTAWNTRRAVTAA